MNPTITKAALVAVTKALMGTSFPNGKSYVRLCLLRKSYKRNKPLPEGYDIIPITDHRDIRDIGSLKLKISLNSKYEFILCPSICTNVRIIDESIIEWSDFSFWYLPNIGLDSVIYSVRIYGEDKKLFAETTDISERGNKIYSLYNYKLTHLVMHLD